MAPREFLVTVSMAGPSGKKRLGVDADWADGRTLYIKSVMSGAIEDWNKEHPGDQSVQAGDRIVAVNGSAGDAQAMVQECRDSNVLQLLVRREPAGALPPTGMPDPAGHVGGLGYGTPLVIGVPVPRTVDVLLHLRRASAAAQGERASSAPGGGLPGPGSPRPAASAVSTLLDHYKVLGIKGSADEAEVKKAYRKLVLQWHPDKNPADREQAEDKIRLINNAYETLGNPVKRATYDQMLAALERKKTGVRLETNFIKPRMSIPKEFMLCPLGHPDRFVRVVGDSLRVQAREEVPEMSFRDFFLATRFSLWWLPEVNNMCRLRVQQSAAQGVDGGLNLNFHCTDQAAAEANIVLGVCQDIRQANLIAEASPFSQGAFRFEGAFWPGRYLSFREPFAMIMAKLIDDGSDVVDFMLVDYSAAYKYMTMSEVLAGAVESQCQSSSTGYVKLSELRANLNVRMYFQQMLGCTVWNNKDFETFFEGHYDKWDFDQKRARVRTRSGEMQQTKEQDALGDCAEMLLRAESHVEVSQAVLSAKPEDVSQLPASALVPALRRLAEPPPLGATTHELRDIANAQRRLIAVVPNLCARSTSTSDDLALSQVVALHRAVAAIAAETRGGTEADGGPLEACNAAATSLAALATRRIRRDPGKVDFDQLPELLVMPLDWRVVADPLRNAVASHLADTAKAPGAFAGAIRAAAKAGEETRAMVEELARWELAGLQHADAQTAAEVLLAVAESGTLLAEAAARLRPPLLHRLPLPDLVEIIAVLAERGLGQDILRPALQIRVAVAGPGLAAVPAQRLLRLANAATRSPVIAECALGPVAAAAASALHLWPLDSIPELLLLVATAEAAATSAGARRLFARAVEVAVPRLPDMTSAQLLRTVVATGAAATQCRALLEAAAERATSRLGDFTPEQVLLLTQGVLPLGGRHTAILRLLDFWALHFRGARTDPDAPVSGKVEQQDSSLTADDIAQLAMLLAMVAPGHAVVFEVIGERLMEAVGSITGAGRESLAAAFPGGAGPTFNGKASLLEAVAASAAAMSEPRQRAKASGDRSRSRSRTRRRSGQSRGAPRADGTSNSDSLICRRIE